MSASNSRENVPDERTGVGVRGASTRPVRLLVLVAAIVVLLDQVTKVLAVEFLSASGYVPLLGEYFGLSLLYNPGAAFGMASGMTWVLALITVAVIVVVARMARSLTSRVWGVTLGLLLGGALGNLIDRLVRAPGFLRGHVVDFLSYWDWFVGNVADIAIVLAAVGMVVLTLHGIDSGQASPNRSDSESAGGAALGGSDE